MNSNLNYLLVHPAIELMNIIFEYHLIALHTVMNATLFKLNKITE